MNTISHNAIDKVQRYLLRRDYPLVRSLSGTIGGGLRGSQECTGVQMVNLSPSAHSESWFQGRSSWCGGHIDSALHLSLLSSH
jgi:hypothetical protein